MLTLDNLLFNHLWCSSHYKTYILNHPLISSIKMVMNRTIQIRLKKEQYERIKNYSDMKGFSSLSGYLRFVALDQDFVMQQKISEIHAHLLGNKIHSKTKRNMAGQCAI